MRKNIQLFIQNVQDTTTAIHPIYKRNFRELIKLIPIIGSWIDANTMGMIEDEILEERLNKLDAACKRALTLDDVEHIRIEIANINNLFFVILLTNLSEIKEQNINIATGVNELLYLVRQEKTLFKPHQNFRLVSISGPSAIGKDCILDLIISNKDNASIEIDTLIKYTTRKPRIVDSKYYDFVSDEQFDLLEKSGNIIFPYFKRGARYGFDRTYLMNSAIQKRVLFCVFTHFESMPTDKEYLQAQGIAHTAILLEACEKCLFLRSNARMLEPNDLVQRKVSITKDITYMNENRKAINKCFDVIINNDDSHSKYETHDKIVRAIGMPELVMCKQTNAGN